jgi:PAS domain S-box-containing protein
LGRWIAALLPAILIAGTLATWWTLHRTDREQRAELLATTFRVAQGVEVDHVRALGGTAADLASPVYLQIKAQLALIRQAHATCRFVYLLGRKADGTVFFFVDSESPDSADCSPPGQIYYEANHLEASVFATGRPLVLGPRPDRWGTWVSGYVPLTEARTGAVLAILGMDVDARDWRRGVARAALPPVLLTLALVAVLLAGTALSARRSRLASAAPRWLWRLEPGLAVAVGLALTAFAAASAHERESHNRMRSFAQLADSEASRVAAALGDLRDFDLEGLSRFVEASDEVTWSEFEHYTAPLAKGTGVHAWEWVPAVDAADKDGFVRGVRAAGLPGFEIWQRDAQGERVPVQGREAYYPVLFVAPLGGNEPALGFDVGSEAVRRTALEEALRTGLATGTEPIALVQETDRQQSVAVFRPVFHSGDSPHLRGFAVAVMRMGALLQGVENRAAAHLELALLRSEGARERLASLGGDEGDQVPALSVGRPVAAFGQVFWVTAHAGPEFVGPRPRHADAWAALTGVLLTTVLAALVGAPVRRRERLEWLVAERTSALEKEEERLTATLRSIGEGVIETDASGRIVSLNPVAGRLTGWSEAEAKGRPVADVLCTVHAETRAPLGHPAERALRAGVAADLASPTAFVARDGAEYQIAASCAPIRSANGAIIGAVLVFRDVTREYRVRRLAQTRLALLEYTVAHTLDELLTKALDEIGGLLNSPIGFCHFVDADQKALTLQQWSTRTRQEFCRAQGHGLHYGVDQAGVWADCLRERQPVVHNDYAALPQRKGLPEGHAAVVRELVTPVLRDGRVVAVLGVGNKPADYTADDVETVSHLADVLWDMVEQKRTEQALRESQARYDQLAEQSRTFTWEVDADGLYTFVSHVVEQVLGYRPEELVGKRHFYDLHPADGRDAFRTAAFAVFARRARFEGLDNPAVTRAGQQVWLATSGIPVLGKDGELQGYRGSDTDITAGHQTEQSYQALFREMLDGFALHEILCDAQGNPVDYRFLAVNPAFERMTGLSARAVVGRTVREILPGIEPRWIDAYGRVALTGEPISFEDYSRDLDKHFEVRAFRPVLGQFACTFADITARRRAETEREKLLVVAEKSRRVLLSVLDDEKRTAAERTRLAAAIEQAGEMIFVTDPAGAIQYVNPAFEAVTGYSRAEALGQNPRLLKSGQQDDAFYRRFWETIASGRIWTGRMVNRRKDGTLFTEDATISAVRDAAGRVIHYVAVKRDITEHLRLTAQLQQAQKMDAIGRLAGGVAHDFNNLLMGIMNYTELCRDVLPPEHPARAYLDEITGDAQRSADLTRQLLAFARKQPIAPQVMDLNDALAGLLKMLRRLIGEDIDLAWLPGARLWPVKLDSGQFGQILANLCVNARDAIGGVGRITLETGNVTLDAAYGARHAGAGQGDYVLLAVSDDGCGMDKEILAHLFEPFFTTKPMGQGTGLGLATVHGIVEQNAGRIQAYSEPGQGTTFKIYFPRTADVLVEPTRPDLPAARPGGCETILLVEDEKSIRITTQRFLAALGYTVVAAETPAEALRLAAAHAAPIHLLVTDVVMPGMSGRDLAERLAEQRPDTKCIFMSGYTADVIVHRGVLDEGMHFLSKPFPRDALALKVREVLDG